MSSGHRNIFGCKGTEICRQFVKYFPENFSKQSQNACSPASYKKANGRLSPTTDLQLTLKTKKMKQEREAAAQPTSLRHE